MHSSSALSSIFLKSIGKMITNPDWLKPKEKPYFHQISLDCIEKLVECMEGIDIEDMIV